MHYGLDKFKEECGVFGVFSREKKKVGEIVYYGLYALQHRGQESAGVAYSDGEVVNLKKGMGLVGDALKREDLDKMIGYSAIGHVRYSTTGDSNLQNAQPLLSKYKLGSISIAHNGNLVNADIIRELLEEAGCIFQTSIDSEVVLNLIARGYKKGIEKACFDAIQAVKGSYAILLLTEDRLIVVRDPNGIRPLCIGRLGDDYILSSESCAIDAVGGEFYRDVEPGEIVVIDKEGLRSYKMIERTSLKTCSFEYIYFARPDSTIDGINVYISRVKAGENLFKEKPCDADIVVGVPDSGTHSAVGYAKASSIPYGMGFVKNKYVGRTFIAPTQELREAAVSMKLNPLKVNIEGKRIVLVDDSIVRGTTMKRLIELLRKNGAKEVHVRIASPIVKYPCYFGIDTPRRSQLIGSNLNEEEIGRELGADSIGFLSIEGLLDALDAKSFCLGCFNGIYPVSAPFEADKFMFERKE
ncbi:MAG: amidophosphoribosyltransferase [Caloramator sp.]|uniref:amidophosphoribosyltransferase n=1 Tax=Caloramator sp. TaxID=1871330 RepID=UPI001D403444|nr:amidophosphoribosyltransferase [Caloramator sp.]MBZ4664232.1 amidophosphoribosyltransferase [Caloramator sp.]